MVDFDYVIVGAGTADCVLASRLSENRGNRVLVLEYGGHDTNPMLYVPEGSISRCGAAAIATVTRPADRSRRPGRGVAARPGRRQHPGPRDGGRLDRRRPHLRRLLSEVVTMSGNVTSDPLAEPALRVDTREELVYLLGQACEIEHGLMCEYLYAQFSLKRGPDEGLTDGQLARVQAWEAALITVIKQEMLHLALATNILTAIGAAPHFERPNFPILSHWYPPGVQIALVPFGERALRHFIYLERPEGMALDDAAGFTAARHARPLTAGDAALVAVPEEWRTVGHLYRGIEAGLAALCARYGEAPCSSGRPGYKPLPTSSSGRS